MHFAGAICSLRLDLLSGILYILAITRLIIGMRNVVAPVAVLKLPSFEPDVLVNDAASTVPLAGTANATARSQSRHPPERELALLAVASLESTLPYQSVS